MASTAQGKQSNVVTSSTPRPGHGVRADFNAFVLHFTEKNTLRYEDFSELWKDLRMPYMLAGIKDYELREAVDHAYTCATELFNAGTNMQTKTCAVYLLYAIYETQGLYPKSRIRVTVSQFNAFLTFVDDMSSKQHYDFVFVFTRLRMERAFLYVATAQPQGKQKKAKTAVVRVREILPTGIVSTFSDLTLDLVEDLTVVNEEYYRVKCVTTNPSATAMTPHASVDLAKPEFIRDITRHLARFDNWRKTGKWRKKVTKRRTLSGGATTSESEGDNASDSDSAPEHADESIAAKRSRIRSKAFATIGKTQRSARYRKVVGESSQSQYDGPSAKSSKAKAAPLKTRSVRRELTKEEEHAMEMTNAHLKIATAPCKKIQKRRRKAKRQTQKNTNLSTDDSEDSN